MSTLDFILAVADLNHSVPRISFADRTKRRFKEFALQNRLDVRNDYYQTGVQRGSAIESQEIGPVVRNKGVVPFQDELHKRQVPGATETRIRDVIGAVSCRMRQFEQGRVQTFVDEQSCH